MELCRAVSKRFPVWNNHGARIIGKYCIYLPQFRRLRRFLALNNFGQPFAIGRNIHRFIYWKISMCAQYFRYLEISETISITDFLPYRARLARRKNVWRISRLSAAVEMAGKVARLIETVRSLISIEIEPKCQKPNLLPSTRFGSFKFRAFCPFNQFDYIINRLNLCGYEICRSRASIPREYVRLIHVALPCAFAIQFKSSKI